MRAAIDVDPRRRRLGRVVVEPDVGWQVVQSYIPIPIDPVKRKLQPGDGRPRQVRLLYIASRDIVGFLAADAARWPTRQSFDVDGEPNL